jgi:hypothetical protein
MKVNRRSERSPVVVGVAQGGKYEFLRQRVRDYFEVAEWRSRGFAFLT